MSTSLVRRELKLANLTDLEGGKVDLMFSAELKRVLMDCLNRPAEKKARSVSLVVSVTPVAQENDCEGVRVAFDVKSSVPARRTNPVSLGITQAGQAWFNVEEEETFEDK